jgi:SNF2 family DNA or RNA helicase
MLDMTTNGGTNETQRIIDAARNMIARGAPNKYDNMGFNKISFGAVVTILQKPFIGKKDQERLIHHLIRHRGQVETFEDIEWLKEKQAKLLEFPIDIIFNPEEKEIKVLLPYKEEYVAAMRRVPGMRYREGGNYVPLASALELARTMKELIPEFGKHLGAELKKYDYDARKIREEFPEAVKAAKQQAAGSNAAAAKEEGSKLTATLMWRTDNEQIMVSTNKYDATVIAAVKGLKNEARRYVAATKEWAVQPGYYAQLLDNLKKTAAVIVDLAGDSIRAGGYQQVTRVDYDKLVSAIDTSEALDIITREYSVVGGKKQYQHQLEGEAYMLSVGNCINADDMGLGKALKLSEKLLTPNGWVRMADVKVGTTLIGKNGRPTKVTGVYPQGLLDMYKLTFSDDSTAIASDEHLWAVNSAARNKRGNPYRVLTTQEIMDEGLIDKAGNAKHYIPMVNPIQHPERDLPIDPYTLGALIGDGSLGSKFLGISTDQEIINKLQLKGATVSSVIENDRETCVMASIVYSQELKNTLSEIGLLGKKSYSKFIPVVYRFASIEQRLALLQGLLDTDGYAGKHNIEYSTSSKKLAYQVQQLVWSLGGTARISIKENPAYNHNGEKRTGRTNYRVNLKLCPEMEPFTLERKIDMYDRPEKYMPTRAIRSIEYIGKEEAQCISVDNEDKLFVINDYVVTHNTVQTILATHIQRQRNNMCPVLIIVPASLKTNWVRELYMWLEEDAGVVQVVGAKKTRSYMYDGRSRKGFTQLSVNDKSGKKFGLSAKGIGETTKADYVIINYDILDKLQNDLIEWQHRVGAGIIIADEAHYLKNMESKRTKAVLGYDGYEKPPVKDKLKMTEKEKTQKPRRKYYPGICEDFSVRYALTGTPVTGKNLDILPLARFIGHELGKNEKGFKNRYCGPENNGFGVTYNGSTNSDELFGELATNMLQRRKIDVMKDMPEKTRQYRYIDIDLDVYWQHWETYVATYEERTGKQFNEDAAHLTELNVLRNVASQLKIPNVLELAEELLQQENKIAIFTGYTGTAKAIMEKFGEDQCLRIVGGMSDAQRDRSIQEFQNNPQYRVIICNYKAAAVGVTLTAGTSAIMADLMWLPSDHFQAEDRLWRIGQKNKVTIYYLIAANTHEESVKRIVDEKARIIDVMEAKNFEIASNWKETFDMFMSELDELRAARN